MDKKFHFSEHLEAFVSKEYGPPSVCVSGRMDTLKDLDALVSWLLERGVEYLKTEGVSE